MSHILPDTAIFKKSINNATLIGTQIKKTLNENDKFTIAQDIYINFIEKIDLYKSLINKISIINKNKKNKNNNKKFSLKIFYKMKENAKNVKEIYDREITMVIDPLKKIFDTKFGNMNNHEYKHNEITNKIGELVENILLSLDGFTDCKLTDIMKIDKSMFFEIKQSHNTLDSATKTETINRLLKIKHKYPYAYVAIGCINGKNSKKYEKIIHDDGIYEIHGDSLLKKITGKPRFFTKILYTIEEIILLYNNNSDDSQYYHLMSNIHTHEKKDNNVISKKKITKKDSKK